jgi:hypothetical protein
MASIATGVRSARYSVELTPFRRLGAAMLGLALVLPRIPHDPGLPCPLRMTTGIPCPLCGLTTSVKASMRLDLHAAFWANPFGIAAVVTALVLLARPRWRTASFPVVLIALAVAGSWAFQLHRFHFI